MPLSDAEAAVVDVLAAAVPDATVAADLVGYTVGDRWLRVVRTGGTATAWMRLDHPAVEIAAYAPDKGAALDLAIAARTAVFAARGWTGHGLRLWDVADAEPGLSWSPDPDSQAPRYLVPVTLSTRPV